MEKNIQTGKRIQIRREELRMNLGDVAKEVGVAVSTIQRYEKGKIEKIKLPVIEAIAKALRVNPAWLLEKPTRCSSPIPLQSTTSFRSPRPIRFPCWATSPAQPYSGGRECGSHPGGAGPHQGGFCPALPRRQHDRRTTSTTATSSISVSSRTWTTAQSPRSASKIRPPSSGCTSIRTSWSSPRITRSTSRLSTPARSFPRCASLEKRWASPVFLIKRKTFCPAWTEGFLFVLFRAQIQLDLKAVVVRLIEHFHVLDQSAVLGIGAAPFIFVMRKLFSPSPESALPPCCQLS